MRNFARWRGGSRPPMRRCSSEQEQPCCYARSNKYWVTDPTGIAWETFHTLGSIPVYGEDTAVFNHGASVTPVEKAATCVPAATR